MILLLLINNHTTTTIVIVTGGVLDANGQWSMTSENHLPW